MGLFDNFKKVDVRSLENPNVPVSSENFLHLMGLGCVMLGKQVTLTPPAHFKVNLRSTILLVKLRHFPTMAF